MSYAEIDFATVPAAPPARKNQRATSWPAPISAIVPYQRGSRLIRRAFCRVSAVASTARPFRSSRSLRRTIPRRCFRCGCRWSVRANADSANGGTLRSASVEIMCMGGERHGGRKHGRLFVVYAVASLVPVVILGLVLASTYRDDANRSGRLEAQSQAALLADDVGGPAIGDQPLVGAVPPGAEPVLAAAFARAQQHNQLVRLRLRDTTGAVVWSDDGSGRSAAPVEDEVTDALRGEASSSLTHLNADANDVGPQGTRVVEVYQPI